jgi:CRISPR-associated RAMP protein (TIGR02581 family)
MSEYLDFAHFHNRLQLTGALVLDTGVRIGAGAEDSIVGADISVVRDAWARPFIPGSSLKGILRAEVERLARTIASRVQKDSHNQSVVWACSNPLDMREGLCVSATRKEELARDARRSDGLVDENKFTKSIAQESCPVCRLFGSPWLAGKLRVRDLPIDEKTWAGRVEVRDGVGIRRDTHTAAKNVLYSYEVVPAGARFNIQILIENANDVELGLGMLGLRELQQGRLSIGGVSSRGLGRVRLEPWETIEFVNGTDTDGLLDYLANGKGKKLIQDDLDQYIKDLVNKLRSTGEVSKSVPTGT